MRRRTTATTNGVRSGTVKGKVSITRMDPDGDWMK
jgi:hypothetical protein